MRVRKKLLSWSSLVLAMPGFVALQAMTFELSPMGSFNKIEVELNSPQSGKEVSFSPHGIKGGFSKVTGKIEFSVANPSMTKLNVLLDTRTLRFGYHRVDTDAQKADWLNSAEHPKISFELESLQNPEWKQNFLVAQAHGSLLIKGRKLHISLPVKIRYFRGERKKYDGRQGDLLMITGQKTLTREVLGINPGTMLDLILNEISVNITLVGASNQVRPLLPSPLLTGP
jgi:polyisoprenoid-binding protein YceI